MKTKIDVSNRNFDKLASPVSSLAIITTVDGTGRINAASFATCVRVHHEPTCYEFTVDMYKDTSANVLETGEFVINIVSFESDMLEKVRIVGLPFLRGVDELQKAGLTAIPSRWSKAPRIYECKCHFECRTEWTKQWMENRLTVVGRVMAASIDQDCIDENGFVIHDILKPAHYCGAAYGGKFVAAYEVRDIPMTYIGTDYSDRAGHNAFSTNDAS